MSCHVSPQEVEHPNCLPSSCIGSHSSLWEDKTGHDCQMEGYELAAGPPHVPVKIHAQHTTDLTRAPSRMLGDRLFWVLVMLN